MSARSVAGAARRGVRRESPRPMSRRQRLHVVRHPPSNRSIGLIGVSVFIVIFGGLMALAALHSVLVQGQNRLDDLNDRVVEATEISQQLRIDLAALESPDRILAEALGRLGMVPPPQQLYLQSSVLGDPTNPVPPPNADPFGPAGP